MKIKEIYVKKSQNENKNVRIKESIQRVTDFNLKTIYLIIYD